MKGKAKLEDNRLQEVKKALIKTGQYRGEFRCEFKDGNEAYVDITISPKRCTFSSKPQMWGGCTFLKMKRFLGRDSAAAKNMKYVLQEYLSSWTIRFSRRFLTPEE